MAKRNSLLENAEPTSNPFAMFQTIPVSNEPEPQQSNQDQSFGIAAPRQAKRTSLKSKRNSAPPSTLSQQQDLLPTDLFTTGDDLFGGGDLLTGGTHSGNTSTSSSARSSGVFDPLQMPSLSTAPRDSVNSVVSGDLFDPNMWGFGPASDDPFAAPAVPSLQQSASNPAPRPAPRAGSLSPVGERNQQSDESDSEEKDDLGDLPDGETQLRSQKSREGGRRASAPAGNADGTTNNCLPEMHRGTALLKYPRRHGFPHFKHVQLSRDNLRIQWFSKRKTLDETCIYVSDVREVVEGQKTDVFKKYRQQVLDKASFSIVYGHDYKTFDVVAKSTDECHMWVLGIRKLMEIQKEGRALDSLQTLDVGIKFRDRNRPQSRRGSGRFLRANNSKALNVDPATLKEVEKDLDNLQKSYHRVAQLSQRSNITQSPEFHNIQQVLSELEERLEELTHEVANTRDTDMSQRDVWRANVDLTAIQEKIEVLLKYYDANGRPKN